MAYKYFPEDAHGRPITPTTKKDWGYMNAPISCLIGAETDFVGSLETIMDYAIGKYIQARLDRGGDQKTAEDEAKSFYDLQYIGEAENWQKAIKEHTGRASIGIKCTLITRAIYEYDEAKGISSNEIYLLAYMALKSIYREYQKPHSQYAQTTKSVLLARMQGYKDMEEMRKLGVTPSPLFENLENELRKQRKWSKFIDALCEEFHMGYYAMGKRGFCFSFRIFHEEIGRRVRAFKEQLERQRGEK